MVCPLQCETCPRHCVIHVQTLCDNIIIINIIINIIIHIIIPYHHPTSSSTSHHHHQHHHFHDIIWYMSMTLCDTCPMFLEVPIPCTDYLVFYQISIKVNAYGLSVTLKHVQDTVGYMSKTLWYTSKHCVIHVEKWGTLSLHTLSCLLPNVYQTKYIWSVRDTVKHVQDTVGYMSKTLCDTCPKHCVIHVEKWGTLSLHTLSCQMCIKLNTYGLSMTLWNMSKTLWDTCPKHCVIHVQT